MRSSSDNEVMKRKAEGMRRLSQAYTAALKSGTIQKVVSRAKNT